MSVPPDILAAAHRVRNETCIDDKCVFDRGCGCLDAISRALLAERERAAEIALGEAHADCDVAEQIAKLILNTNSRVSSSQSAMTADDAHPPASSELAGVAVSTPSAAPALSIHEPASMGPTAEAPGDEASRPTVSAHERGADL